MKTNMILKRLGQVCLGLWAIGLLCGCERNYLWYDAEQKDGIRMVENSDTIPADQIGNGDWMQSSIRMELVGFAVDYDRHFKVEIVDSLTTVPSDMYSFEDTCYIPANETYGMLRYFYARSADTASLGFRIVENDNFRPVMRQQVCCILYPSVLSEPQWWKFSEYMFGAWSERVYELFFQFYQGVEQTDPYIWNTYFKAKLGENMEHWSMYYSGGFWSPYQWQTPYKELLRKYVARPLYDYLKEHPEDGDYTKMPNPYDV